VSQLRLPNGDDHPEAAAKHLGDATSLLNSGRADGAAYLAGYVVECSLKSLILIGSPRIPMIHDLRALSLATLRLAALPNSRTARYGVPTPGHSMYDSTNGWKETLRYQPAGAVSVIEATAWCTEALAVYSTTIAVMKLDGLL
jgi:hypothetical protein